MNAFIVISKYIIILLCITYVFFAFISNSVQENKYGKLINRLQWCLIMGIHFTAYFVMGNIYSGKYYVLWLIQTMTIVILTILYNYIYDDISKPLYNNMIMLIVIGMIILGRLNFSDCIRQFVFLTLTLFIGLFVPYIISRLKTPDKLSTLYATLGIALLLWTMFFGVVRNGAKNWISLGPVVLQPSEFAKILFVFALAGFLSKRLTIKRFIITSAIAGAFVLILVAEKDLGGALLFYITFLVLVYIATNKLALLISGVGALSVMCIIAYHLFDHVKVRVTAFLDPFSVIDNQGYQLTQSYFAIGSGGLFGTGLGKGYPQSIPVVKSDYVFSAISEELGAIVAVCVMLIYLSCFIAFLNVAVKMKSKFYKLLAVGIVVMFIVQVILNLGGVTGFLPATGVTLPLISQGGSSAVSVILMFSVIQGLYSINVKNKGGVS